MASGSSSSSKLLFGKRNQADHVNKALIIQQDYVVVPPVQPQTVLPQKRRNPSGTEDSDVEVIRLSPNSLMEKDKFVCEVCQKGFPREQNLELHKRGHNLPWSLKQTTTKVEMKKKVYLCPEPTCVSHNLSHALKDPTGMRKHYFRKHGERKFKCPKCTKMYAVESDLKAHSKTCGAKVYKCHCGIVFTRRDNCNMHRLFCRPPLRRPEVIQPQVVSSVGLSSSSSLVPSTKSLTSAGGTIAPVTGTMSPFSSTALLQKTGSTSSSNRLTNLMQGYASSSNSVVGGVGSSTVNRYVTSESYRARDRVSQRYDDLMRSTYNLEQQQEQQQQSRRVLVTRDFLGLGEDLINPTCGSP